MKESGGGQATSSGLKLGFLSALLASLCCIGPLVLILLGVGGASTALSIGYRKPYFLLFGLVVLGVGFYRLYKKSCQKQHLSKKRQLVIFGGSFVTAALLYYLLTSVVTPLAAPLVYQWKTGGGVSGSLAGNKLRRADLSIEGMWCASCAVGAEYNLKAIEGVEDAYVGFTEGLNGEGWVVYESGRVSEEQIIKAVEPYEAVIVSDTVYTGTN